MGEANRIADQLRRSARGEAWHGPSVLEVLDGVTAGQAAAKPIAQAHSIWELLLHITAWEAEALHALGGKIYTSLSGDADWPPVPDSSDAAWSAALANFREATDKLDAAVRACSDDRLKQVVAGREFSFYFLLHGVIQHNLYHAGQMILLKKLV